jgi:glyoxylase-like metal-dependent hydrolase (beta-lactamase superfamily II)
MQQLIPGLYQLTRGANMFLVETDVDELTLIDAGIAGATNGVLQAMQSIGKQPQHLKHILITHADIDHAGSIAALVAATGATVYASSESTPYIEAAKSPPHGVIPMSALTNVIQSFVQSKAHIDKQVSDGETLPIGGGILALATPGHTPDHYSYYWQKTGVLFAGDLFFAIGGLSLTPAPISWSMDAARNSARKVLDVAPSIICVGHGQAVNLAQTPAAANSLRRQLTVRTSFATT